MIYLFDEFALDDQRYQFRRADDMLEVEPKVFDLLVYLIRHRERFVSREELIEQLWPDVVVSEAALTQCVAKARKAVRDGGGKQQVIKTQHGRGYRFVGTVTERSDGHSPPAPQIETPLHDTSSPVQAYARTAGNQSPVLSVTQPTRVDFVLHVILPTALRNARFAFTFLLLGLGFIAALQYLPLRSMPSPEMKYAEQGGADSVLTFVAKDPKSAWFLSANKPEAAAYCLRGWDYYSRFTPEANAQARQIFERAVAIDPQYPTAYVSLGWTYVLEWSSLWTQEAHGLDQALVMAQRALTLNNALPYAHALLSSVYLYRKEYELALAAAERAVALEPACADCFALLADILTVTGQARKAIEMIEHARHLDPSSAASYAATLGRAYYLIGQPGLAAETLRRAVIRNPTALVPRLNLALAYSEIGRVQKARAEISEVLRLNPHLTLQALREHMPHQNPGQAEYLLASLHKVGLQ